MEKRGVDVSVHNGNINWQKVKDVGIQFAMIRLSYGQYSVDKKAIQNIEHCIKVNMPFGVYVYSYALNDTQARREASLVINTLAPYKKHISYPVVIDMEDADGYKRRNGNPSKSVLTHICKVECDMFKDAGYYPMIYANLDWFRNRLNVSELVNYDKWLAQWSSKPTWGQPFGIWQYTSSGKVDGISGNVDMNIAYKDYPDIILNDGIEPVIHKSNEDIATEVINGEWGNGDIRKQRLEYAGYDYNTIQTIVNNRLSGTKDINIIVHEVIDGKWGNGDERKRRLGEAGYSYDDIQKLVNERLINNGVIRTYTVKHGDYLSKIGQLLGVNWLDIAKLNGIKEPYIIYSGQILKY